MGRKAERRYVIPPSSPTVELPEELVALVEKRAGDDRRVKDRRGGPPRRSLGEPAAPATHDSGGDRTVDRRKKQRRKTSARRTKSRRR